MTADTSTGTTTHSAVVSLPSDTQILITREFNAPRHLVYEAYTTPELIARWWSGDRGSVTSAEVDLRAGGTWRYVMKTNDGFGVAFHGTFSEIVANERLVNTEVYEFGDDPDANAVTVTTEFVDIDGRTLLRQLSDCPTHEIRDMIIESGMELGMQEALDHLEDVARTLR